MNEYLHKPRETENMANFPFPMEKRSKNQLIKEIEEEDQREIMGKQQKTKLESTAVF